MKRAQSRMKYILLLMLATGVLGGCVRVPAYKSGRAHLVDFRVWIIESDSSKLLGPVSPGVLFEGVSNETAKITFERRVAIVLDKETILAGVEEVVYPTTYSLNTANMATPASFMTTDVGTTIVVTIRRIPSAKTCTLDVSCEFSSLLGVEEYHRAQATSGVYTQSVPRFLKQTVNILGPLEPGTVHLVGSVPDVDGQIRHIVLQYGLIE